MARPHTAPNPQGVPRLPTHTNGGYGSCPTHRTRHECRRAPAFHCAKRPPSPTRTSRICRTRCPSPTVYAGPRQEPRPFHVHYITSPQAPEFSESQISSVELTWRLPLPRSRQPSSSRLSLTFFILTSPLVPAMDPLCANIYFLASKRDLTVSLYTQGPEKFQTNTAETLNTTLND